MAEAKSYKTRVFKRRDTPLLYELPVHIPYSVVKVAEEVRERAFPELDYLPPVYFGKMKRVAFCEAAANEGRGIIVINSLFNHPDTPREVLDAIVAHEYLHLLVRPREHEGKETSHPPEFFEQEDTRSIYKNQLWNWLHMNFTIHGALHIDVKKESTTFRKKKLYTPWGPRHSIAEAEEFFSRSYKKGKKAGTCL